MISVNSALTEHGNSPYSHLAPLAQHFRRCYANRGGVASVGVPQTIDCGVVFRDVCVCLLSGPIPKYVVDGSTCHLTIVARLVPDTVASKLRFLLFGSG